MTDETSSDPNLGIVFRISVWRTGTVSDGREVKTTYRDNCVGVDVTEENTDGP